MPRKKGRKVKVKIKQDTVYSITALICFGIGLLGLASYTQSGDLLISANGSLSRWFGGLSLLAACIPLIVGCMLLRIKKFFLSEAHVSIGYILTAVSLFGLFKTGTFGGSISFVLSDILGSSGADLIFIAGFLIGLIVLFDKPIDEVMHLMMAAFASLGRLFRFSPFSLFKSKRMIVKDNKREQLSLPVRDEKKEKDAPTPAQTKEPIIRGKQQDTMMIADTLLNNAISASDDGVWEYPSLQLLNDMSGGKADRGDIKNTASVIEKTLHSFGIAARVAEVNLGPAVTQYALEIALGTKVSKITSLSNDLALATEAPTGQIRIEAPIPGRNLIGIEIPNRSLEFVTLKTMLSSNAMQKQKSKLAVSMGLDVSGNPVVADIAKMPHVLIAGTTGSGKSIFMNSTICSLLFRASPQEVRLIMIDPKRVEMTGYNGIPHLLTPVIVEPDKILSALRWAMGEMDKRYKVFAENGVKNIEGYNELSGFQALPYIIIFIDELADLMAYAPVEVEDAIARLAQMARATGIHLVIATQRPSVDVITGLIKANIPTRIAFTVASLTDSRVILDTTGAEKLLGRGDMLYIPPDQAKPTRIQGAFVSEKEVAKLVTFLKQKAPVVQYTEEVTEQPVLIKKGLGQTAGGGSDDQNMLIEAIRIVCQYDRASASLLQRKLKLGYSRAARIIDELQELGVISLPDGAKPREVLMRNAEEIIARLSEKA